jgi:hypothetical protein
MKMACRRINERYANEGYIIKEIDLSDFLRQTGKVLDFPKNGNPEDIYKIFRELNMNSITQQAIMQQYNELYIYNEATPEERELLAPQVKVDYSLLNLPDIYYPKFYPLMEEKEVWSLNERDLSVKLGSRLQQRGITFDGYKKFVDGVVNLCEEFDLREDDILLNPSNIGYHPVLGLRIIDYGLTNDNNLLLDN